MENWKSYILKNFKFFFQNPRSFEGPLSTLALHYKGIITAFNWAFIWRESLASRTAVHLMVPVKTTEKNTIDGKRRF